MPVYLLDPVEHIFPHPDLADEHGIVAIGGDLNPDRILTAYRFGLFPWYNEEDPIIWWSPDPRAVIYPGQAKVSKSMKSYLKKYELRIDTAFESVIKHCKFVPRREEGSSWITHEMQQAYIKLYEMGYAHSFESWYQGKLIGGLYGLSIGKCFFGESMFSLESNASKFAFICLSKLLREKDFTLIDCQIPNDHLMSMGCKEFPRKKYLEIMRENIFCETKKGKWTNWWDNPGS